ncbi:MAG: DUF748 domain-containing protein [Rhodocyclaceae bacterium]|nr:DUF748 domain-containing protein [Rhodocyclaceae bacterium]
MNAPTPVTPRRRWPLWLAAALLALAAAGAVGLKLATDRLHAAVVAALGPNAEVERIEAGFSAVAIHGIRIRAGKDWPAADELAAQRVLIRPDWNALLAREMRIAGIEIEGGYVSMLRRRDGSLAILSSLLDRAKEEKAASTRPGDDDGSALPEIVIGGVTLTDAAVDFHDASVRRPAHRLRIEKTRVELGELRLPALTGRTTIRLDGTVKGVQRDGTVSLQGWAEIATKDSELRTQLAGVDLVAFQPYLIKAAETGVRKGALDLDLKSTVQRNRLHAPGRVVLSGLELAAGGSFMGMPREAVVKVLQGRDGRIAADFVLEGDIADPKFSLNENFLAQVAAASAGALGISLEGLAAGIGGAGGSVVEGVGSALDRLLGGRKK